MAFYVLAAQPLQTTLAGAKVVTPTDCVCVCMCVYGVYEFKTKCVNN